MKKAAKARAGRRRPLLQVALICLATYLALFAMLYAGITPEQYDIQVGVPSPTLIKATKDIVDTVTTEALREAAANAVEPSYRSIDPTVLDQVVSDLSARFDALRALRTELGAQEARELSESELAEINDSLSMSLTREQIATLIETSDTTLDSIFSDAIAMVEEILTATLPEGQESNALRSVRDDLSGLYSAQLTTIVVDAVRGCIQPNMLIDEEITAANREAARESVEPVTYLKDQTIVSEGEVVTLAQYTMIASMGILSDNTLDLHLMAGVALLTLLGMLSLCIYLLFESRSMLMSAKQMLLLCLILLLQVGWALLMRLANGYLIPVSLGLLLVALLMDASLAVFVNVILSLLTALYASTVNGMFSIALMSILCGPVIVLLFSKKSQRTTTLLAGAIIAVVNFLVTISFGLFTSAEMDSVLVNALWAAAGGAASAILCIAFQPLLEWLFNLATSSKLIELSNPNQPLLRRLLLEASGTYHHSIIVANLAEAGCTAIGANGLLARVGAYYHDIGKLKRPMYFKENQMGDNPHDRTDPRVSTAILTAHTRDGAQMAQKARIPEPVVDIIRQHHGDTPVMYFYDKAKKLYGDQVDISAFRYEGPRPQSREAAVVMLADTIEAATRALPNPDPEKIDALIRKLVRGKLNDGQLDNSSLTFNDLDKICSAFSTVLTGVFHERIEYPDVSIPPRMERAAVEGGQAKPAIAEAQSAQREGVEAPANAKAEGVAPEGNSKASEGGERPAAESEAVRKPAGDAARLDSPASGGDAQRAVPREAPAARTGQAAAMKSENAASTAPRPEAPPDGREGMRAEREESEQTAGQSSSALQSVQSPEGGRQAPQGNGAKASPQGEAAAKVPASVPADAAAGQAAKKPFDHEASPAQPQSTQAEGAQPEKARSAQGETAAKVQPAQGETATRPQSAQAVKAPAVAPADAAAGQAAKNPSGHEASPAKPQSTQAEGAQPEKARSAQGETAAKVQSAQEGAQAVKPQSPQAQQEAPAEPKPASAEKPQAPVPMTGRPCAPVREQGARGGGADAH